ncbi:MAG: hypothetical protein BWY91_01582 [bacterium ADurb.BinA028]|nr:MAG: hypothetical protein BWY91_01582 [bacterium ADurb.BinA028]HBX80140.1 hypothetical protein [Propionibacteriaceae bacterium]
MPAAHFDAGSARTGSKMFTARLPEPLHDALTATAAVLGRTPADLMREALIKYFEELDVSQVLAERKRERQRQEQEMLSSVRAAATVGK